VLDGVVPRADGRSYSTQVEFVRDRPGHDRRYAIDPSKLERETGWRPKATFEEGLKQTVMWYLDHPEWAERIQTGTYRGERLGVIS